MVPADAAEARHLEKMQVKQQRIRARRRERERVAKGWSYNEYKEEYIRGGPSPSGSAPTSPLRSALTSPIVSSSGSASATRQHWLPPNTTDARV